MKKILPKKLFFIDGFTLIELLVVMTIIGILFGIGIAQYMNFNRSQILEQAAQDLKNNLRLAQTKAINGEKPRGCISLNGYRVKFFSGNPDYYILVAVCNGTEMTGLEAKYNLPSEIKFNPLPSPSQILFKVLAQGTDLENDLTITLAAFGKTKTIKITKQGKIE
jgi:prepilin-type N-terminal cleavage/methylation domain-containing protein